MHFKEHGAKGSGFFAIKEQSPKFGFGGTRGDHFEDVADNKHGAIDGWHRVGWFWWDVVGETSKSMVASHT